MKKIVMLIVLFTWVGQNKAQVITVVNWTEKTSLPANDIIYYNANKKLQWADFKGIANQPDPVAAITTSGFGYKLNMHSENGKGVINIDIYCYFSKPNSWVKKGRNTVYILNHEQHHFDVTYLAAKKFIDSLKATPFNLKNLNTTVENIYKKCNAAMQKMQNDYDTETKNGQLKNIQTNWDTFFENQLALIAKR